MDKEALVVIELVFTTIIGFVGGYKLLGSKRAKDQKNKHYGWIFYAIAYAAIAAMAIIAF